MKGLDELLVLDFSKLLPGPFCTMLLADLGCRVVRVELPYWKDMVRDMPPKIGDVGFVYWMVNRNKESLALDFRKPEGKETLLKLVAKADVLVEGFRPGLMERIGFGPKEMCRRFPRLVYCSLTGYGQTGPMSQQAGHDLNFLALSGLLGLGDSNGTVSFPATQIADLSGAMYAALAILAAVHERNSSGKGQHVDVAMAEAAFSWVVLGMGHALAAGKSPGPKGEWWNGASPFYRFYRCKDGRWLAAGALEKNFSTALLQCLDKPELQDSVGAFGEASAETARALEEIFASKTREEWTAYFEGKDVCVTPVLNPEEAMKHPFFAARGSVLQSDLGTFLADPMRFSRSKAGVRRPPPRAGQDGAKVLRSLGVSSAAVKRLQASRVLA